MEEILSIHDVGVQEEINKLDYFVVLTSGEISFETCLQNPEMLPQIHLPGFVAFAERLRFFQHPKLLVNQYVKNTKIRGPVLFRRIGKETPIECNPQERVIFHFDRIVRPTSQSTQDMIRPLPLLWGHPGFIP